MIMKLLLKHRSSNPSTAIIDNIQELAGVATENEHPEVATLLLNSRTCSRVGCESGPIQPGRFELDGTRTGCKGCVRALYCSRACQRQDWPNHKAACERRQRKLHARYCDDFGGNECMGCGRGRYCHLCGDNGRRRHKYSCPVWREVRIAMRADQQGGFKDGRGGATPDGKIGGGD